MDPIKYIFEKLALTGKISRWKMLLFEFDIVFVMRKAIKGQAIVNYLADQLLKDQELVESLFPDEDFMALEPESDSGIVALKALFWWSRQFYRKWSRSSLSFP